MSDGHVYPQVDKYNWGTSWTQRPMLFHNLQGKKFENVPAVEGTGLADVIAGRGMAIGDLFNDGKIDAVINVMDGHPVLLRNVNPDKNHWMELKLIGGPKSPRDAVGATVYLTAGGMKQREDVISGGSYLSSQRSAPALRPWHSHQDRRHRNPLARRQSRTRHRPWHRSHRHSDRGQRQVTGSDTTIHLDLVREVVSRRQQDNPIPISLMVRQVPRSGSECVSTNTLVFRRTQILLRFHSLNLYFQRATVWQMSCNLSGVGRFQIWLGDAMNGTSKWAVAVSVAVVLGSSGDGAAGDSGAGGHG